MCLDYLGDLTSMLAHYRRSLKPDGLIGLTMWLSLKNLRIWRRLSQNLAVRDEAVVSARWGGAWFVATLDPC